MSTDPASRYVKPGSLTVNVFNRTVQALTRAGISVMGSRVLYVRGRTSGEWRSTPVNLLTLDGDRFLVAPRGQTQWVRNLRVAGGGELRVGRRVRAVHRLGTRRRGQAAGAARLPQALEVGGRHVLREHHGRRHRRAVAGIAPGFPVFRIR